MIAVILCNRPLGGQEKNQRRPGCGVPNEVNREHEYHGVRGLRNIWASNGISVYVVVDRGSCWTDKDENRKRKDEKKEEIVEVDITSCCRL